MSHLSVFRKGGGFLRLSRAAILCAVAFVCLPAVCTATASHDDTPPDSDPKRPSRSVIYSYPWIGKVPKGGLAPATSPGLWNDSLEDYIVRHWADNETGLIVPGGGNGSGVERRNYAVFVDGMDSPAVPPVLCTHFFWRDKITRSRIFTNLYTRVVSQGEYVISDEARRARRAFEQALSEEPSGYEAISIDIRREEVTRNSRSAPGTVIVTAKSLNVSPHDWISYMTDEQYGVYVQEAIRHSILDEEEAARLSTAESGKRFVVEIVSMRRVLYDTGAEPSSLDLLSVGAIQGMAEERMSKEIITLASKAILKLVHARVRDGRSVVVRSVGGDDHDTDSDMLPEARIVVIGTGKYQNPEHRYR